jgi:hypothetical protein
VHAASPMINSCVENFLAVPTLFLPSS